MPPDKPDTTYLCQRCGNCCRWPGDVIVTEAEIKAIAVHLKMKEDEFIQHFTRLSANRKHLSLTESEDGACIFLEGKNTCQIQPVKPGQCRGFPNRWRLDGWREICEAIEVEAQPESQS
jgi:Fe-S-cluster containining protein